MNAWWKGGRGEWYVAIQFALFGLVGLGPKTFRGWPPAAFPTSPALAGVGWALLVAGGLLALGGVLKVGSRITPLPYPPSGAVLRTTGAFCIVRHPMYCGAIAAAFGWAIVSEGWLRLAYAALLIVLFDLKTRREEAWLSERFPEYEAYRRRVRKLIPFVY